MKLIITTEDELTSILARVVGKCFDDKKDNPETLDTMSKQGNYTAKDLQDIFCISTTTLWNWQNKGILKPVIVNRKKVYLKEDIEALIQQKKLKLKSS